MKLSVIYEYSNDIKPLKSLIAQLTKNTELIIIAAKAIKEIEALNADNVKIVKSSRQETAYKTALSKAQGGFVSFIYSKDKITSNYIECILNALTEDADYIPLKWIFADWHGYKFTGNFASQYFFGNIYKSEIAKKMIIFSDIRAIDNTLLEKYISGAPVTDIIYEHYKG